MGALLRGQLAYVFLTAILDAALISWIALRWYRRSVRRLMRERGAAGRGRARRAPRLTRRCHRCRSAPARPAHRRAFETPGRRADQARGFTRTSDGGD